MRPQLLDQPAAAGDDELRHSTARLSVAIPNEPELDQAFLDWFECRLANNCAEPSEEDVLDYLVAWALLASG